MAKLVCARLTLPQVRESADRMAVFWAARASPVVTCGGAKSGHIAQD